MQQSIPALSVNERSHDQTLQSLMKFRTLLTLIKKDAREYRAFRQSGVPFGAGLHA
jgi:hypothetical protein